MGKAVDLRVEIDDGRTPPGYHRLHESLPLNRTDFERAAHDLLCLRAHEAAGLDVRASDLPVVAGSDVRLRLGIGALAVTAPCSVLEIIDEPARKGFIYGTSPGIRSPAPSGSSSSRTVTAASASPSRRCRSPPLGSPEPADRSAGPSSAT